MRASAAAVTPLKVVVEGDPALVELLTAQVGRLEVTEATAHIDVSVRVARPDVVLLDLGNDAGYGLEKLRALHLGVPILALIPNHDALAAIAAGASGALHRQSGVETIAAALTAITEGLAVFDRSFVSSLVPASVVEAHDEDAPAVEALTTREREVLLLLAEGLSNKEIGVRLEISDHTAKFHVNSILQKLSAQKRVEAVVRAARLGLIQL